MKRSETRTTPSSHTPYCYLSREEMLSRMAQLHNNLRHIQKQRDRLRERVSAVVEVDGEVVNETLHNHLKQVIQTEGKRLMESADPGSLQRVFFQQQLESSSKNDARGMRWQPLMIRWCIYLCHQSQGAYETLVYTVCACVTEVRNCTVKSFVNLRWSRERSKYVYQEYRLHVSLFTTKPQGHSRAVCTPCHHILFISL